MSSPLIDSPTTFDGFGPSILARQMRGRLKSIAVPEDRVAARRELRENCPRAPGVYGWLDANGRLSYVGKSRALRNRLLSYFAKSPADKKMERIRQHSQRLVWEPISHELLALLRELELIHRWRPEFNSMGQPTRMQPAFLCIGGSPAPNARLVRRLNGRHLHAYGPVAGTGQLREAIVAFNQVFRLRDCPDKTRFEFGNQRTLFDDPVTAKCIRYELGSCPGPCAAICTSAQYNLLVERAVGFLNGDSAKTLQELQRTMNDAAKRGAYETAAIARDRLDLLKWLDRRLQGLRKAKSQLTGVLCIPARRGRTAWMVLQSGRIRATMLKPDAARRAELTQRSIEQAIRSDAGQPLSLLEMSLQLVMISWFRKHNDDLENLISFEQGLTECENAIADSVDARQLAA